MIRIGIVGVGFMGMIHYLASRKLQGAKVVALCSRDKKKLEGDWRSIRGNFGLWFIAHDALLLFRFRFVRAF